MGPEPPKKPATIQFIAKQQPHIYETNFTVDRGLAPAFLEYLKEHMSEIMGLENGTLFDRVKICEAEREETHEPEKAYVCVQYRARSRWKLQVYFDKYGEALRKDMADKFGGKYTVTRRILAIDAMME